MREDTVAMANAKRLVDAGVTVAVGTDAGGTLEAGKAADLLLLDADPTADVRNVQRIRLVMKGGAVWTRAP
jgi:imidazolonepropionase-like amidohydrolase